MRCSRAHPGSSPPVGGGRGTIPGALMPLPIIILLPVYEDWQSASLLLPKLAAGLRVQPRRLAVLIVDDGSTEPPPAAWIDRASAGFEWVRVLRLTRNLGHQRAIAVGLSYIDEHLPCTAVVVMDADGEDRPEDVPRLLARSQEDGGVSIVFAERQRRAEGVGFRTFYLLYRLLHRVLTGTAVRVGNFSVLPRARLASIVVVSELWIHYAASAFRSRQPIAMVPTERGVRLASGSSMSFVSLVVHGLSAISVYSDVVLTRLVVVALAAAGLIVALLVGGVIVSLSTPVSVPIWAVYASGLLLVILVQAITVITVLTFQILGNRQQMTFVPRRDYGTFVSAVAEHRPAPQSA
jgi:hypothetical protein